MLLGIAIAALGVLGLYNVEVTGQLVAILIGVGIIAMGIAYLVAFSGIHKFDKEVAKINANIKEMMQVPGFVSINFSGNMGVIKTRPGYASAIAWNIDSSDIPEIIGTIAGDDTIFIVIKEGVKHQEVIAALNDIIPSMR